MGKREERRSNPPEPEYSTGKVSAKYRSLSFAHIMLGSQFAWLVSDSAKLSNPRLQRWDGVVASGDRAVKRPKVDTRYKSTKYGPVISSRIVYIRAFAYFSAGWLCWFIGEEHGMLRAAKGWKFALTDRGSLIAKPRRVLKKDGNSCEVHLHTGIILSKNPWRLIKAVRKIQRDTHRLLEAYKAQRAARLAEQLRLSMHHLSVAVAIPTAETRYVFKFYQKGSRYQP